MSDEQQLIPVRPDAGPGYTLYAVTWLSVNGEEITRLIGALSPDDAAATVARLDHTIRRGPVSSIDVRECAPVIPYASEIVTHR